MQRSFAVVVFVIALVSSAVARPLPRHRPRDFSVDYQTSGGMRPDNQRATVAAQSTYQHDVGGQKTSSTFTLTDKELDRLYAKLRKVHVETIRFKKERIYDRGGVTLAITAGGHTWTLDDAGLSVVVSRDAARLEAAVEAVTDTIHAHVAADPKTPSPDDTFAQ